MDYSCSVALSSGSRDGRPGAEQFYLCCPCINPRASLKYSVDYRSWNWFFGVNIICGLAVNAFDADSFLGKILHYLGSILMILLGLGLIFIGTSKRTVNVATSIPKLGLKTGIAMQIVNTKQWMVIFSLLTVMLTSFESEPGGIPGGVPGTFFIATVNTSFGVLSMGVWTNVGNRVQQRISNPKFARIVILALGVLLLMLSALMLLRYHFG